MTQILIEYDKNGVEVFLMLSHIPFINPARFKTSLFTYPAWNEESEKDALKMAQDFAEKLVEELRNIEIMKVKHEII